MDVFGWPLLLVLALAPPGLPPVPSGPPGSVPVVTTFEAAPASARLRGVVRGEDFVLDLATVTLELVCIDCTTPAARVRPDLRGGFEFWGLPAGDYRLVFEQEGRSAERPVAISAGSETVIELVIPRAALDVAPVMKGDDPLRPPMPVDDGQTLRRAGLVTTILGVTLGIGGALVATLPPCGRDGTRGANCETDIRNTIGLVLGITGAGAVTAGIASMAVGRSLQRRQRIAAGLAFDHHGATMVLVGRF